MVLLMFWSASEQSGLQQWVQWEFVHKKTRQSDKKIKVSKKKQTFLVKIGENN